MSNEKMRAEFEAVTKTAGIYVADFARYDDESAAHHNKNFGDIKKVSPGDYVANSAQDSWLVWQAARAQPAGEEAALSAAAAALDMAHGIVPTQPSKPAGEAVALEPLRALTSESGRKYVADFFINTLRRHDFTRYINEKLAADFACTLAVALHGLRTAPPAQVPDGFRIVGAAELAMVLNALNRDAEEGRPVRKEMADALASSVDRGLAALAAAPQPKGDA